MRIYWRPRRTPFSLSMPWWLALPVGAVWLAAVAIIYVVIGMSWLVWLAMKGTIALFGITAVALARARARRTA